MAYPIILNGRTYTLTDFEGTNYVDGFPDALEDFVTQAGDIYNSTSASSVTIGTGSKSFTTADSDKPYQAGTPLRIADASAPETNFLDCIVTSYSGTALVVEAFGFAGSGSYSNWTINIGGAKTVDGILAINQGGTGATTTSDLKDNLGFNDLALKTDVGIDLINSGIDPAVARAVIYNDIGAPVAGGYFAGVIDTVSGTIQSNDDYQTGQRYALIVAPKELEGGRGSSPASGLTTGDLQWDTTAGGGEAGTFTRWNGLDATNVLINKNDARYEVHNFIEEVRNNYEPAPTQGGSTWYLPALDELELLYRNFKSNYADNFTGSRSATFPGSFQSGSNLSSSPSGSAYSNSPRNPEKTSAIGFRDTEVAAIDQLRYWSTTDANEEGRAWNQNFTSSGDEGGQAAINKNRDFTSVRPVRRVVL